MAGRKRKPTAMLKASGTFRDDRHGNKLEAIGRPTLPSYQNSEEAFKWLVDQLDDLGVVAETDAMALQMLADAWEDYCAARAVVKSQGPTYITNNVNGDEVYKTRPELQMMQDAWNRIKKMLPEFGLTASARAKLNTPEKVETLDDLLNG